jgi:hypothetical protein
VPTDGLTGTLEKYNADVAAGEDTVHLKKPGVLRPVDTPPFYATDDSIAAIRASLGLTMPAYEGTYYSFSGMVVDPTLRAGTPLWGGDGSRMALRRALRTGHGWRRRDCSRRMPGRCSPSSIRARGVTRHSTSCSCRVPSR